MGRTHKLRVWEEDEKRVKAAEMEVGEESGASDVSEGRREYLEGRDLSRDCLLF